MGHLIPNKRLENLEIRISFCTKKRFKKSCCSQGSTVLCSRAHELHVAPSKPFSLRVFILTDSVFVLLKYLLFNCIKTSFGLQAEKGNANMVETPCHGNSRESMCELQPHAAALWDSLACTAAQERSTSSLRSSMVRGLVSTIMASLLCHFVMTTSTLLDSQGNISKSSYPTNAFNTPAMF